MRVRRAARFGVLQHRGQQRGREIGPVLVKHREAPGATPIGSRLVYARHPFDVVGWDGCLYPYAFNIADFEPIVDGIASAGETPMAVARNGEAIGIIRLKDVMKEGIKEKIQAVKTLAILDENKQTLSARVARLTPASVACADSTTATSSV